MEFPWFVRSHPFPLPEQFDRLSQVGIGDAVGRDNSPLSRSGALTVNVSRTYPDPAQAESRRAQWHVESMTPLHIGRDSGAIMTLATLRVRACGSAPQQIPNPRKRT